MKYIILGFALIAFSGCASTQANFDNSTQRHLKSGGLNTEEIYRTLCSAG